MIAIDALTKLRDLMTLHESRGFKEQLYVWAFCMFQTLFSLVFMGLILWFQADLRPMHPDLTAVMENAENAQSALLELEACMADAKLNGSEASCAARLGNVNIHVLTANNALVAATKPIISDHQNYQGQLSAFAAVVVLMTMCGLAAIPNFRLLQRHIHSFWTNPNLGLTHNPNGLMTAVLWAFAAYLIVSLLMLPFVGDHIGIPTVHPFGPRQSQHLDPALSVSTVQIFLSFLCALIWTNLHLAAYTAHVMSSHYPWPYRVEKIRAALKLALPPMVARNEANNTAVRDSEAADLPTIDMAIDTIKAIDIAQPGKIRAGQGKQSANIASRSMTAKALMDIVDRMIVPVIVVMVLSVFFLGILFNIHEAGIDAPEPVKTAIATTHKLWISFVGLGFSGTLLLIYGLAYARLAPYIAAAAAFPKTSSPANWSVAGTMNKNGGSPVRLSVQEADTPAAPHLHPDVEKWLGADTKKFRTIMESATYGSAVQSLIGDTIRGQLVKILGLIAPAAAAGVLGFL